MVLRNLVLAILGIAIFSGCGKDSISAPKQCVVTDTSSNIDENITDKELLRCINRRFDERNDDYIPTDEELLQLTGIACYPEYNITSIAGLGKLQNLGGIYLYSPNLKNISAIRHLHKLTSFALGSDFVTDISPLCSSQNIDDMGLEGKNIRDISPLAFQKKLKGLSFLNLDLSDISALSDLPNLEDLSLEKSSLNIEHIISIVKTIPNLTMISLNHFSESEQKRLEKALPNINLKFDVP